MSSTIRSLTTDARAVSDPVYSDKPTDGCEYRARQARALTRHVAAALRQGLITNEQAGVRLALLDPQALSDLLVDAIVRGGARQIFCDDDGLIDGANPHPDWYAMPVGEHLQQNVENQVHEVAGVARKSGVLVTAWGPSDLEFIGDDPELDHLSDDEVGDLARQFFYRFGKELESQLGRLGNDALSTLWEQHKLELLEDLGLAPKPSDAMAIR